MSKALALPHQLLLLELDDSQGTSSWPVPWATYGINGAAIAELLLCGAAERTTTGIRITNTPSLTGVLAQAAQAIGPDDILVKAALYSLTDWNGVSVLRPALLKELIAIGALREQADKVLFVRWRTRFPTADGSVEQTLRERLRDHAVRATGPLQREDVLLSLLHAADQLGSVFTVAELQDWGPAIERRAQLSTMGAEVQAFVAALPSNTAEIDLQF